MKVLIDSENDGMLSLMGKEVLLLCGNYFYGGLLVGVNDTCVKLQDPKIIYETGPWGTGGYTDCQKLHMTTLFVQVASIEAFGEAK